MRRSGEPTPSTRERKAAVKKMVHARKDRQNPRSKKTEQDARIIQTHL